MSIVIIREMNKIKITGFSLPEYQYEKYLHSFPSSVTTSCGILGKSFKLAGPQFLHLLTKSVQMKDFNTVLSETDRFE